MHKQKKKRQHFVWRKYLRKWASNEKIFCLMGERIFETDLMNVAQEKYFYELKELTGQEISFLKALIEKDNSPMIRKLNHGWIEFFDKVFDLKNRIDAHGVSHPEIDKMFDVLICNFEEDLHCSIESEGNELLESLYKKDLSFYDNDDRLISFLFFICQQYFRTQRISSNVKSAIGNFKGFNIDAMWAVLRHTCATSVGVSLYRDREEFHPVIIENKSDFPFVTGDQPVINTYAVGLDLEEEPEDLEFYYPLTPSIALLLTKKEKYRAQSAIPITKSEVMEYNRYIHGQSGKQIYGSNRNVLEEILRDWQSGPPEAKV